MVLPNLPQEIIAEILTRLPVKPLLRFRCVSKSWLSLIDAPQFIKSQLNKNCNSHRLAFSVFNFPFDIYSCLLDSPIQLSTAKATLLDSPFNGIQPVHLLGSCNGLICILGGSRCVILWNPSTKKCRELPQLGARPDCCYVFRGFGYDELNDDYKLVQIFSTDLRTTGFSVGVGVNENRVNIYSLRTNSWRNIKVNGLLFPASAGKFVNGALHWLVKGFNSVWSISSFDLANETFQNIDLPNTKEKERAKATIGSLGGCLCICGDYYQNRLDLWILENGGNESWTKLISIPYSIHPKGPISPLFVLENGEILLLFGSRLVLYNKKDETFYYPDIRVDPEYKNDACIYVESLVSPKTLVEKENQ